ncbi:MAG: hypothetical protein ACI4R9_05035 [Kiritimatiellia bacterium]
MTTAQTFEDLAEANACLDSLGGYVNPTDVSPLKGEAAHEVAVGPVHAGVIEPGHFRFQCMGEDVYNLQIFLGYQHRGVEDEIVKADGNRARQIALAETCAGDSSIAAAICFAEIVELASHAPQPPDAPASRLRELLLALERIANHVGDLGALAGDVAFLPTASFCGRIRGEYLNMTALICGNRFGRNAVVPGGLRVTLTEEKRAQLKEWIVRVKRDLDGALGLMFEEPTVLERLEGTGVVPRETAEAIGLVGVARRASVELRGDVLSRARIRQMEIEESHQTIFAILDHVPFPHSPACQPPGPPTSRHPGFRCITATTQAWRGPLVHAALFGADGRMRRYRIVDPSAHNWQGLAYALRGEQIANFPICNKSFNLSYCGTDR